MNIMAMTYPDTFLIKGIEYKGNKKSSKVNIPCTGELAISAGDIVSQKICGDFIELKVIELSFLPGGSFRMGTKHPDILTLTVENLTAMQHATKSQTHSVNIGNINANQVQVGHGNTQKITITIQELVERIEASDNAEAKSLLRKFLENPVVANIVGVGIGILFKTN